MRVGCFKRTALKHVYTSFLMHISCFIFFANELLFALYFIPILDYGKDVRQKAIFSYFFYLCSKWDKKQQSQLIISTMHLVQKLLMNKQHSGGSRSFAKEMRALKKRNAFPGRLELTTTNRGSSKQILLQIHKKLPKNSTSTILQSFSIWSKLERWKNLISGCLMSWLQINK